MQQPKDRLPVILDVGGAKVQATEWGGITVSDMNMSKGVDMTPLLVGMPDDMCQCPHWGYVLKGAVNVRYTDGREEVVEAGQVYYWPPGHTVWFEQDTEFVKFSPAEEMDKVLGHVANKIRSEKAAG